MREKDLLKRHTRTHSRFVPHRAVVGIDIPKINMGDWIVSLRSYDIIPDIWTYPCNYMYFIGGTGRAHTLVRVIARSASPLDSSVHCDRFVFTQRRKRKKTRDCKRDHYVELKQRDWENNETSCKLKKKQIEQNCGNLTTWRHIAVNKS